MKPADEMDAIAVLPFENASGDPHAEYLSDGITDSLINSLAQLGSLRVLARSTVFRYKGRAGDPQQSGRELKARVVLTGRVLLWGETLVIGAELVDVTNGWQLWGERYKRSLTDIFDVQEEIARVIVDKLRVKLSPVDERKLGKRYTDDPEAYQLYLKGLYFLNKWSPDGFRMSEEYFRQAVAKDPNYAPAYAGIADINAAPPYMGLVSPSDAIPKAKAAVAEGARAGRLASTCLVHRRHHENGVRLGHARGRSGVQTRDRGGTQRRQGLQRAWAIRWLRKAGWLRA